MEVSKAKYFENLSELTKSLTNGISHAGSELCNFFVDNFDLEAAVLFKSTGSDQFTLLGKSLSAKESYAPGINYGCKACSELANKDDAIIVASHAECGLPASESVIKEKSLIFKLSQNDIFLLKLGKKTSFNDADQEALESAGKFLVNLLSSVEKNESSANVIAEIAHELRNPVNSIMGFASLLGEDALSPSQMESIATLKENAFNHLSLINDVIELSKIEAGNSKEKAENISVKTFIDDILTQLTRGIDKRSGEIKFLVDISKDVPEGLKVDSHKLRYILTSLISYSIELTGKGKITISVSSSFPKLVEKGKLNFKISDTSGGLTNKQISNIFKPFSIFESGGKIKTATGISILISKKYVELLDGEMEITSSIGKGITYNFEINSEQLIKAERQTGSAQPAKKDGKKNRVLLVEDDYAASKLLSGYLKKWGYEPVVVNSSSQALKAIENEIFLAVLMDIILPDSNGFELLKHIREHKNCKNTPVIICSVEAEQQKAFLMGAVEYFVKPIQPQYLIEALHNYKLKRDSNILIVDDDVPTLQLIKGAVERAGFNALAESHPSKVDALISNTNLDLAIIDLDMPEINGYDLIKQIKLNPKFKRLPVVIYTGKENYKEELKKIDGLFEELLLKGSTNIEELSDTINQMINRYDEPPSADLIEEQNVVKILLVEDYKHSQIIVTRLLKKNNFEHIIVCENGAEAVEKVKEQKFDLILMDMQMPVMNGFEATEKIREMADYKETPIIALTAFAMKGDREKCLEAGATDYIPKPIDSNEFIEKVKHYAVSGIGVS